MHVPQLDSTKGQRKQQFWSLKTTIFEAAILLKPTLQTLDTSGDCLHDFDQILNPEGFGQPAVKARGQALISPVLKGVCCDSHNTNFGVGPQLSDLCHHFHTSLQNHRHILPENSDDRLLMHKGKTVVSVEVSGFQSPVPYLPAEPLIPFICWKTCLSSLKSIIIPACRATLLSLPAEPLILLTYLYSSGFIQFQNYLRKPHP